ncbi:amidohydrolase family protein [Cryptosporangium sp. NPDC051539]|uniref:amidohydrolase family protein n=1 Tax=Cryptosporangium sp. NPDC051539 TaxID=3363962 RepID=UPI0037966D53
MLIQGAEVDGVAGVDVRIDPGEGGRTGAGRIVAVGRGLAAQVGEDVVTADGGALIPGLHDHHVHLRAWAATRWSVPLGSVRDPGEFDRRVRDGAVSAPSGAWLRGVGWHESTGGALDRYRLDALTGARPARVQHRTGAMWVLNSAALRVVGAENAGPAGIERDASRAPTGRLYRLDDWLRDRIRRAEPDPFPAALSALTGEAAARGVTRFTDATPGRDQSETDALAALAIPQHLTLMSPPGITGPGVGPHKIVLNDTTLPEAGELAETIRGSHRAGFPVAVHCVTVEQLVTLLAAIEDAGGLPGDRVEHAGVVPPGSAVRLARQGIAVVTNPGFLADRGDVYRRDVPAPERDWLYPVRSLLDAGVTVAAATDAPFGPADPWVAIAAAVTRRTPDGEVLGPHERIYPAEALRLFLEDPDRAGGRRRIAPGQPSDVCLLHVPLEVVLRDPSSTHVRATFG